MKRKFSPKQSKLLCSLSCFFILLLIGFKIWLETSDAPADDKPLLSFYAQNGKITFSVDNSSIITGIGLFSFAPIQWWDAKSGKLRRTFTGPVLDGDLIIVSKDERLDISCRKDVFSCRIQSWEMPSGKLLWKKTGEFQDKLALSSDNRFLVGALDKTTILPSSSPVGPSYTMRNDYSIQIWDVKTGLLKRALPNVESYLDSLEFSADNNILVVATREEVSFWNTKTWKIVQTLSFPFPSTMSSLGAVTFSPDIKKVMLTNQDGNVEIWDWRIKKRLCKFEFNEVNTNLAFSPDGKYIAGGGSQPFLTNFGKWQMWRQRNLPPNDRGISGIGVIRGANTKGALRIWNANTGKLIKTFYTGENVSFVAFSPDGKTVASNEPSRRIRLWDVSNLSQTAK